MGVFPPFLLAARRCLTRFPPFGHKESPRGSTAGEQTICQSTKKAGTTAQTVAATTSFLAAQRRSSPYEAAGAKIPSRTMSFVCHTTPHSGSTSRRTLYSDSRTIHDARANVKGDGSIFYNLCKFNITRSCLKGVISLFPLLVMRFLQKQHAGLLLGVRHGRFSEIEQAHLAALG